MKIETAVRECKATKYVGWQMVTFVQKYVNKNMQCIKDHSRELPTDAFAKGRGNCWQQACCVHYILKKVNIKSELVFASKAKIYTNPDKKTPDEPNIASHAWCKVTLNGTVKDVCSCCKENIPGNVHFEPVSSIIRSTPLVSTAWYAASVWKD